VTGVQTCALPISYKFVFLLLIPAIIILLLLGKWLLLVFGENYSDSALSLLQILALSGIFTGINTVYYTILRVERRIRELIALTGLIALAVLVGSYIIMPVKGIVGVGYIWLVAQGVLSIYVILVMRQFKYRRKAK
jgi:O-antigen/teichoic acid export membrane protein